MPRATAPGSLLPKFVVALALCGAFAGAPKAAAYSLEGESWSGPTVTFVLSLGSPGRTLSDGSTSFNAPGAAALGVWNQYMQNLQINAVTNDSAPVSQRDGVNSIAFASTFFGDSFGSNTLAITGYSYSGGRFLEANVLVSNRWNWDSYRGALRSTEDLRRVLIHEVGHALGLDHPDQHGQRVSAIMNSIISNIDTAVTDDINGIQALYGVRNGGGGATPTPTPNPTATPTPTPTATPFPTATPVARVATISAAPTFIHVGETSTVTVRLSSASSSPVTVYYFASADGRARRVRTSFYAISGTPGQVTIPAGSTSATFTVTGTSAGRRAKTVSLYLNYGTGYTLTYSGRGTSITVSR
jgi:hypothetical protein